MKKNKLKLLEYSKVFLCFLVFFTSMASIGQNAIKGSVSDQSGPLPGANIVVKGTSNGTQSDFDGNYSLNNVASTDVLVVSFLGYKTKEVNVSNQTTINITLEEDNESLDEVVVVGYGTQRKSDLTGAVSVVKGEAVTVAPTPNLRQNLSGKLPGVITTQDSGKPGGDGGTFLIRGKSTFSDEGNQPLVLIDGVVRSIDRIDPNAVESITVLKDAASAAIYGARAANGVILVTTKRGASGAPSISFNSSVGFQSPTNVPEMLNAGEFAEFYNEARANVGDNPAFTDEQVRQFQDGTLPNTNWWDAAIKNSAPIQQYGLTVSGGGKKVRYFTSLGMLDQKGLYKSSAFKRYNVRANIDVDLTDRLTFGVDLAGRKERINDSSNEPFGTILAAQPTSPAFVPDEIEPGGLGYNGVNINPIGEAIRSGYDNRDWHVFQGTVKLDYDIPIKGLNASFKYSHDHSFRNDKEFKRPYTFYVVDPVNDIYTPFESISNITLEEESTQLIQQTSQFILNYNRDFGEHRVGGVFVIEQIENKRSNIKAGRQGFISPALDQLLAGGAEGQTSDGGASEGARQGYVGRFTYSYNNRYLFQANVRRDGSNIFPENSRWGTFPAFSVGWKVSEENFLKDVDFIQSLKLRASWGKYGNDRVDAFQYLSAYEFRYGSVIGGAFNPGIRDTGVPNPNITWETATDKNFGVDFALFSGKITGEFNLFNKRTEDILRPVGDVPDSFGGSLPDTNQAITENNGFELAITYKDKIGDNFNFTISPNITKATNKIEYMAEPEDVADRIKRTGRSFGAVFGWQDAGLFRTQEEIDNWADQDGQGNASINTGDIKYVDLNDDGVIDGDDRKHIGKSTIPEIIFGLNLSMNYKNLDFSASFQGATDFNSYAYLGAFGLGKNAIRERVVNAFRDGNENAPYPRTYFTDPPNNTRRSTFWMIDGSYVKLRNVELGYTLPKTVLDKLGLSTCRVFISGNNLLTFSKFDFFDPERPFTDNENILYYPQMSRVNFGFNVNF